MSPLDKQPTAPAHGSFDGAKSRLPDRRAGLGARRGRSTRAFTLAEVLVAMGIAVICISGIMYGYVSAGTRAEWSAYSLAAEELAIQRVEQARSCPWDYVAGNDQLIATNFPMQTNILDILSSGTNVVWATNFTTITSLSTNPPYKMIQVDCVWAFMNKKLFTNTIVTYRGPDD